MVAPNQKVWSQFVKACAYVYLRSFKNNCEFTSEIQEDLDSLFDMLKLALMAGLTNKRITIPKLSAIVSLAVSRAVTLGPCLLKRSFTLNLTDALWHFRFRCCCCVCCCVCCCQLKNCFQLSCFSTA